jgi:predicted metal-binding membrane protein
LTAERPQPKVVSAALRSGAAPILAALVAFSWGVLWIWGRGPYGRYLEHGGWIDGRPAAALCRALPAGRVLVPLTIYAGGWLLMTAAMMLPTALPLIDRFDRAVAARADRRRLTALVILGYLVVWAGFGVVAHVIDAVLHQAVRRSDWLLLNGWILGALILAAAGLFQFSRLKYRCLARCRTPFGFIARHWRGPHPLRNALLLGLDHGVFCVGCCWAIMLLMFVVGTGNVGWMLALGGVMALEKNTRWGARVTRPLGAALLVGALLIAGVNLASE